MKESGRSKSTTQSYGQADDDIRQTKAPVPQMEDPPLPQQSPELAELETVGRSVSTDTAGDEAAAAADVLAQLNT